MPIMVNVALWANGGFQTLTVNGVVAASSAVDVGGLVYLSAVIPAGAAYWTSPGAVQYWAELR